MPEAAHEISPEVPPGSKLAQRIGSLIKCRDKRRALKKKYEEGVGKPGDPNYEPGDKDYALLENSLSAAIMLLLGDLNSAACPAGTAFKTTRTTAALSDPDAFMKFVIENQLFDLLDRKANTTAVKDYVTEHNGLPPGVNLSSRVTIGVHKKVGGGADTPAQSNGASHD